MSVAASLGRRIALSVSRAVIRLVNDAAKLQGVQVVLLDGEARAEIERFQQYGFTSVPLDGCEAIALSIGGSRSHMAVVATDDRRYRYRNLQPGETCIYNQHGDRVHIREDGTLDVVARTKVYVDAPMTECTGNAHVKGNVTCDGDVSDKNGSMQEMREFYNAHMHGSGPTPTPEMT